VAVRTALESQPLIACDVVPQLAFICLLLTCGWAASRLTPPVFIYRLVWDMVCLAAIHAMDR
jgi:hypothetical protein